MVKSNELRVGNWIFIDNGEKPKYAYQVTAHDIEEIEGNGEDCFPIPLTEEKLLKSGFIQIEDEEMNSGWYRKTSTNSDNFIIWNFDGVLTLNGYSDAPLLYLHQLQNLYYAITGNELNFQTP